MAVVRELLTRWGFLVDDKAVDRFNSKLDEAKKVAKVASAAIAGAAVAAAALVVKLSNTGDKIAKTARQLGIAAGDYQRLSYAADMGGASQEQMAASLRVLSRQMDKATRGSKEQREAFDDIGVSVTDTTGRMRPTVDVLLDVADAMQAMPGGADKAALAMKVFGRGGLSMITALEGGADGVRSLMREADAFGAVMDDSMLRTSEELNDDLARVKAAASGLGISIGSALLPRVLSLVQQFNGWFKANRQVIAQKVSQWANFAADAFGRLWDFLKRVGSVLAGVVRRLGGMDRVLDILVKGAKLLIAIKMADWFTSAAGAAASFATKGVKALGDVTARANLLNAALAMSVTFWPEIASGAFQMTHYIQKALNWLLDGFLSFIEMIVNGWQDMISNITKQLAKLGIMDAVEYEKFTMDRPEEMTDEQAAEAWNYRFNGGKEQIAENNKKRREAKAARAKYNTAAFDVGAPQIAHRNITVSQAELNRLTGFTTPSATEMARLGGKGQLVTGPIAINAETTITLPPGATLQDVEQVRKYVAPVIRDEIERATRQLQADLETL